VLSRSACSLACFCAAISLAAASPAVAPAANLEGQTPFSQLTEGGSESSETPTSTTSRQPSTSKSTSSAVLLLSLIAAGALLAGIAFVILRDARRVAPVPEGQIGVSGRPARDTATQMRRRRAKAKAARQQRRRNR
jgi:hypothetical protein